MNNSPEELKREFEKEFVVDGMGVNDQSPEVIADWWLSKLTQREQLLREKILAHQREMINMATGLRNEIILVSDITNLLNK